MRYILSVICAILLLSAQNARAEALGDAERGGLIFRKCASCHAIGEGAQHRVGPHLNGIFERRAGAEPEYTRYSEGLVRAGKDGLKWDFTALDAYLENPKSLVSGTRMNFAGLADPQDRHDVIAYLRRFSANPQNIPEAAPTAAAQEVELSEEILAIVGDRDYGAYLASECQTCHQRNGTDQGIPSITGWPQDDFIIALHAYKREIRPHPVMQSYAKRLSDEEIASLALYFETLQ